MRVVSFYTGPGYMEEADALRATLQEHGVPHSIRYRKDLGDWCANCAQKPVFLREMRDAIVGPMLWLDADARLMSALPPMPDCDMAYHRFRGVELVSNTLYFGDTLGAREILAAWCVAQTATVWDQKVLQKIVDAPHTWKIVQLPEEMSVIDRLASKGVKPVVYQTQASRRLKKRA